MARNNDPETNPRASEPMDFHIGSRVRIARGLAGYTVERFAQLCGVQRQQAQKWENGTTRLHGGRIYQIAQVLQVAPGWFFHDFPGGRLPEGSPDAGVVPSTSEAAVVVRAMRGMSRKSRASLAHIAELMAKGGDGPGADTDDPSEPAA